jgi:tRNA (adenine57-N1/adenine58-N1)-methyltransferase
MREDFANRARANVVSFLGDGVRKRYRVEIRDVYDGIDEQGLDRMVLDLPEPWRVIKHAETALRPGGILLSYLPSIGQVAQLRDAIDHSSFGMAETIEVLQRGWHIDGPSVRPDHRMVAHTGFLSAARLLAGKAVVRRGGRSWPFPSRSGPAADGGEFPADDENGADGE